MIVKNNKAKNFLKNTLFKRGAGTRPITFHAYDLETTLIPQHNDKGEFPAKKQATPKPLYITAYSEKCSRVDRNGTPVLDPWQISEPLKKSTDLKKILLSDFLTDDKVNERFVAWNGNNFDVYFIGMALLDSGLIIRPYITKSNAVRGLKVIDPDDSRRYWEFLDGIAMTGVTTTLKKFIAAFAPDHGKLQLDFAGGTQFDSSNPDHRAYALRDSVGLYHALKACDSVVETLTDGMHLTPTVGNLGIKFFQKMMPEKIYVRKPNEAAKDAINYSLKRGGYCYLRRPYSGPVWKYDINQAYAAAMRECALPCGRMSGGIGAAQPGEVAMYRVSASVDNKELPPFYWKHAETSKATYSHEVTDAWITSDEHAQLKREGWSLTIEAAYYWEDSFSMKELVDHLEALRMSDPQGPSGPVGTMCKSLGNNAYGKTAEQLGGEELIMVKGCPEGYLQWREGVEYIWSRVQETEEIERGYHQPQIASFITAYVRMVVRRAILTNVKDWIYADTDCVMFASPAKLNIDPKKYGMWKVEEEGAEYRCITKKGYYSLDKKTVHIKGMNIRHSNGTLKFTDKELKAWWEGTPPKQAQTQRKNFMAVLSGDSMYHGRKKVAQKTPTEKEYKDLAPKK